MERVKNYEKYWSFDEDYDILPYLECGSSLNSYHYEQGLYFHTKEEAEAMVRKIRAVLKGAEVIEMPSEEEITIKADSIFYDYPHPYEDEEGDALLDGSMACDAMVQMVEWLKSKIVK